MTVETQLNPTQPVNQQIYRILRRDIVHCLIAPGTPLSEKEVSVRFNVSRQPVREAFIKLAENGLIQIRPQRGSYVNKISMAQVRNGSFIRQAIECAVARRAASMITESQCYQLEQNLHQQRIAIERKQLDDFFELDDNFHQLLTQIAVALKVPQLVPIATNEEIIPRLPFGAYSASIVPAPEISAPAPNP